MRVNVSNVLLRRPGRPLLDINVIPFHCWLLCGTVLLVYSRFTVGLEEAPHPCITVGLSNVAQRGLFSSLTIPVSLSE